MKKYVLPIVVSFAIIVFFLGFIDKDIQSTSNDSLKQAFNYGVSNIPEDLKNATNLSSRDEDIICALSKGLVYKSADNKIMPALANEITESSDGIQYEFKLSDDIYWSDGTKISPNDIVTFFKELLKEEDSKNIEALLDVYGAKEFKEGIVTFETGVAIKAMDHSVVIRLNKKNNNFLSELSKPQYRLRKYLIMWSNLKNNYNKLIYSGDYRIDLIGNDSMVLKKNNNSSNEIASTINIFKDDSVELSMASYEVKQRDIVIDPPESQLNKLSSKGKLITMPKKYGTYLAINNNDGSTPIQGRREIYRYVSKALEEYQNINNKELELAEGSYFREDKDDLTKLQARKVSSNAEGEWEEPEVLTIIGIDNSENRNLVRGIQSWFKNNTDISIRYSFVKEDEFNDKELKNRYDMVLINNNIDILDKKNFYLNFKDYLTESEDKILENISEDNKEEVYSQIEENLFESYTILPLVFYNENIALSEKVSKLDFDGNGNIDFNTIK